MLRVEGGGGGVGFSAEASLNLAFIVGMFRSAFIMNASGR